MSADRSRPERLDWDVYRFPDGTIVVGMMGDPGPDPEAIEFPVWETAIRRPPAIGLEEKDAGPRAGVDPDHE